jgi:hypothetical protein
MDLWLLRYAGADSITTDGFDCHGDARLESVASRWINHSDSVPKQLVTPQVLAR